MKIKLGDRYYGVLRSCAVVFFCLASDLTAYQTSLSFDSLFPMTWYHKGLESSLRAWQSLIETLDRPNDGIIAYDLLLGRLAFTRFCVDCMRAEASVCIADDKIYFSAVLDKVRSLLAAIIATPKNYDFLICAEDMIQSMQKLISSP